MPIFKGSGDAEGVTSGQRALKLFCDREDAVRNYLSRLNEDPPPEKILFFHGDGGNGKSLLLRYLQVRCSVRFSKDNWEWVRSLSGEFFSQNIEMAQGGKQVATAALDFGMAPRGEDRPQEAFSALLMMRRMLGKKSIRFPLYDFASIWYLHRTDQLDELRLKSLFPSEELDVVVELAKLVQEIPGVDLAKAIFSLVSGRFRERWTLYLERRKLSLEDVAAIQEMDAETTLIENLPRLFALDLNAAVEKGGEERVALFFDAHEAFYGTRLDMSTKVRFERDEWLRTLLGNLELQAGIAAVIAGRELPDWEGAPRAGIPDDAIEATLIGSLPAGYASEYLMKAGLADTALRDSLIGIASIREDEVHPLYLGLACDYALQAAKHGPVEVAALPREIASSKITSEVAMTLLQSAGREVESSVVYLSACRAFDFEVYSELAKAFHLATTKAAFDALTEFSFVWASEDGRYRIHDLLRKLFRETSKDEVQRADVVLRDYYAAQLPEEDLATILNWLYHGSRMDARQGALEWGTVFRVQVEQGRVDVCRALLGLLGEMNFAGYYERSIAAKMQGDYFAMLARYDDAEQQYQSAVTTIEKALAENDKDELLWNTKVVIHQSMADAYRITADYARARENNIQAIAACERATELLPESNEIRSNYGLAVQQLAQLYFETGEFSLAERTFNEALDVYRTMSRGSAPLEAVRFNEAYCLRLLGDLHQRLGAYERAANDYSAGIAIVNETPEDERSAALYGVQTLALLGMGLTRTGQGKLDEAERYYEQGIRSGAAGVKLSPDDPMSLNNLGIVNNRLADVLAARGDFKAAAIEIEQAIRVLERGLEIAPGDIDMMSNSAAAYHSAGNIAWRMGDLAEAEKRYKRGIEIASEGLERAPEHGSLRLVRSGNYFGLAEVSTTASERERALESYKNGIRDVEQVLTRSPEDPMALGNMMRACRRCGELHQKGGEQAEALEALQQASRTADKLIECTPDNATNRGERGLTLVRLGAAYGKSGMPEAGIDKLEEALLEFETALGLEPRNAQVRAMRDRTAEMLTRAGRRR